ncbi:hypothetical protein AOLI_G00301300 [Acnodon oligacanthus]
MERKKREHLDLGSHAPAPHRNERLAPDWPFCFRRNGGSNGPDLHSGPRDRSAPSSGSPDALLHLLTPASPAQRNPRLGASRASASSIQMSGRNLPAPTNRGPPPVPAL